MNDCAVNLTPANTFHRLHSLARILGCMLVSVGLGVITGWIFDIEILKRISPGLAAMNPVTAFLFTVCGTWLWAEKYRARAKWIDRIAMGGCLLVITVGMLRLFDTVIDAQIGIDTLIFRANGRSNALLADRMASTTAVGFITAAFSFLLLDFRTRTGKTPALYLAGGLGLISLFSILSYAYDFRSQFYIPMAVHSAFSFAMLAVAIFCSRPDRGIMEILISRSTGGMMMRWLFPTLLVLIPFLGWARLRGERAQLFCTEVGTALLVITIVIILISIISLMATSLHRSDLSRAAMGQKAKHQTDLLASVLESVAEGVVVADEHARFLHWNPAAEHILGLGPTELMPDKWSEHYNLFEPDGVTPVSTDRLPLIRALSGESVDDAQMIVRRRGAATDRWLQVSARPLHDDNGNSRGGVASFRDFTDQRQANEALRKAKDQLQEAHNSLERRVEERTSELARSNKELDQFAYVASHDLQQPLRMVASYVQLLERRYANKLDGDALEFINYAVEGTTRMKRLINDLLTFSRVGTHGRAFEATDCEKALRHTFKLLEIAIRESGATITHGPLPIIMADETQLIQLLQNLIDNAIKYRGGRAPEINVTAEKCGGAWQFCVQDNGIGIETQYVDRIFLMFQRLHGKNEYAGTGIGLAVCKKVVERHGGRIWVESRPGEGSKFYFTIPCKEIPNHEEKRKQPQADRDLVGGGRTR